MAEARAFTVKHRKAAGRHVQPCVRGPPAVLFSPSPAAGFLSVTMAPAAFFTIERLLQSEHVRPAKQAPTLQPEDFGTQCVINVRTHT